MLEALPERDGKAALLNESNQAADLSDEGRVMHWQDADL
ncbi:hypothetical protein Rhow_006439 [Rhodococcus wratislaviensis]|uniref:Uncharacterized protein n=1 Tax=Rhodococcus wratislaviensis TaxID=44752 RepID=A0A402CFY3_RHOWR|nr:hypothetical protein Rhow_006439 [Rhodococcus wratislaviensis]